MVQNKSIFKAIALISLFTVFIPFLAEAGNKAWLCDKDSSCVFKKLSFNDLKELQSELIAIRKTKKLYPKKSKPLHEAVMIFSDPILSSDQKELEFRRAFGKSKFAGSIRRYALAYLQLESSKNHNTKKEIQLKL